MPDDVGTFTENGFSFNNLLNKTGDIFEKWAEAAIERQFAKDNIENPVAKENQDKAAKTDWMKVGVVVVVGAFAVWLLVKVFR